MSDICHITCTHQDLLPTGEQRLIVTIIGDGVLDSAFADNDYIVGVILASSVTLIGSYAFHRCTNLTSIIIPPSVTCISTCAFSECTSLTSIIIPPSVTHIGTWAFGGCTSLTSIIIPSSVTMIGREILSNCINLRSVIWGSSVAPTSTRFGKCVNVKLLVTAQPVSDIEFAYDCPYIKIVNESPTTLTHAAFSPYFSRDGLYTTTQRDLVATWLLIRQRLLLYSDSMLYLPLELWMLILTQLKLIDMGVRN